MFQKVAINKRYKLYNDFVSFNDGPQQKRFVDLGALFGSC